MQNEEIRLRVLNHRTLGLFRPVFVVLQVSVYFTSLIIKASSDWLELAVLDFLTEETQS